MLLNAWISEICTWAKETPAVAEAWLFGSQAGGKARADSDVDVCIRVDNLALYLARGDDWQHDLANRLGRHVSLEAMLPDTEEERLVLTTGRRIYLRS